jgi:hypothetical protein
MNGKLYQPLLPDPDEIMLRSLCMVERKKMPFHKVKKGLALSTFEKEA